MHIYDFLTDEFQTGLKNHCRTIGSTRFEEVLDYYRQRFMQYLENNAGFSITSTEDSRYLSDSFKNDKDIQIWFETLLDILQSEQKLLARLFEEIIDCYYLFIRGRHHTAVLTMFDILEKYDMLNDAWKGCFGLFYRCANLWTGADENAEETYYHIPFNLRGKIKNQRFSVSGMPIWYGGASLLTSYYEMRQKVLEKHDSLAIST